MNTDKLINSLCDDLEPVKPLAHPLMRARPWLALAIVYMVVATFISGIRPDLLSSKLHDTVFIFEILIALSIVLSTLFVSFWANVPDMRGKKWLISIPITLTLVFITWTISRAAGEAPHIDTFSWHSCFRDGIIFATLPITGLIALSARGTTTCPLTCALLNILCASAMGFIALRITCVNDSIEHALLHHLAPFVVLGIVVGGIARRFYRW